MLRVNEHLQCAMAKTQIIFFCLAKIFAIPRLNERESPSPNLTFPGLNLGNTRPLLKNLKVGVL
jgi:hypothetical protein